MSETDIKAVVNTLKYVRGLNHYARGLNRTGQGLALGVLYSEARPGSKAEAEKISALIQGVSGTPIIGSIKIQPAVVSVENINSAKNVDVLFITGGMSENYSRIARFSQDNHVFNISLDADCAKKDCCFVSIQTDQGVEIFLNDEAMKKMGFDVDAAFRYMAVRI